MEYLQYAGQLVLYLWQHFGRWATDLDPNLWYLFVAKPFHVEPHSFLQLMMWIVAIRLLFASMWSANFWKRFVSINLALGILIWATYTSPLQSDSLEMSGDSPMFIQASV